MHTERIQYLLQQYTTNQATRQEVEELFAYLKTPEGENALKNYILDTQKEAEPNLTSLQPDWDTLWLSIQSAASSAAPATKVVRFTWMRIAAAVLVLVIAGSLWYYFSTPKTNGLAIVVTTANTKKDIAPGGNKALLTLADGTTIALDTVQHGFLALQGHTKIIKQKTGELIYNSSGTSEQKAGKALYNTISTPHGGQYHLVLPDGSKVWLNAGSSLCFPATFTTSTRVVQLTGEAYFEVKPQRIRKPFIVSILSATGGRARGQVEVLGTHFNVNAYNDESVIKTTLLEGKVKVSSIEPSVGNRPSTSAYVKASAAKALRSSKMLSPGKQAILNSETQTINITNANTEQAVAWKNGFFRFKETSIREVMRQVERWYDVEVEYSTGQTDQYYTGVVSRSQNISALLKTLELTGTVHFKIDDKPVNGKRGRIVVMP
jgi:transmembrane sensor